MTRDELALAQAELEGLDFVQNRLPSGIKIRGHSAHYRARYIRCGKRNCAQCPHGPYVYLVWWEDGAPREKYVGHGRGFR